MTQSDKVDQDRGLICPVILIYWLFNHAGSQSRGDAQTARSSAQRSKTGDSLHRINQDWRFLEPLADHT